MSKDKTDKAYVYRYEVCIVEGEEVLCEFTSICRQSELQSAIDLMLLSCQEEVNRRGQPE